MKQLTLFFFIVSFLGCNSNQYTSPVVSRDGNYEGDDGVTYTLTGFSSGGSLQHATKLDNENRIIEEGLMFGGLKDGAWISYDYKFQRDNIASVINYKDGVKHGPYHVYENSQLKERGTNYQGQKDGVIKMYNRGKLVDEMNYRDGALNGMVKRFYEDGTLKEEGNFVDGKRDGNHKWYDLEGNVIIEYVYKNGEKVE